MKRVKTKQKSKKKYYVSQKQMDKVARQTANSVIESAIALVLSATHDELGLTAEQAKADDFERARKAAEQMKHIARKTIAELAQVGAMAAKITQSMEGME